MSNPKVSEEEIVDLLEDIMDQEFDTICDDNSIKEISGYLVKYLQMLLSRRVDDIRSELSLLPPCEKWIVQGRRINFVTKPDDESSSDDDDEEMESDVIDNTTSPSTSGSTMQVEVEDIDPGWTIVKGKKRK